MPKSDGDGEGGAVPFVGKRSVGPAVVLGRDLLAGPVIPDRIVDDLSPAGYPLAGDPDPDGWIAPQVSDPIGPITATGEHPDDIAIRRKPDLYLVRCAGVPSNRFEVTDGCADLGWSQQCHGEIIPRRPPSHNWPSGEGPCPRSLLHFVQQASVLLQFGPQNAIRRFVTHMLAHKCALWRCECTPLALRNRATHTLGLNCV